MNPSYGLSLPSDLLTNAPATSAVLFNYKHMNDSPIHVTAFLTSPSRSL